MVTFKSEHQAMYFVILTFLRTETILVDAEKAFDKNKRKTHQNNPSWQNRNSECHLQSEKENLQNEK